jgi:transcriptional regulator with XRE-family HTH domain
MAGELHRVIRAAIKAERTRAGLSQRELGARLGVSHTVISNLEQGPRALTLAETPAMCEALGITLDRLLVDADPMDLARLGL